MSAAVATLVAWTALGAPPGVSADVAATVEVLSRPRTITANFTQAKTSKLFATPHVATGRLLLARPARVRLEYTTPHQSVLVATREKMSIAYPKLGDKQVFDAKRDPEVSGVFASMLALAEADTASLYAAFEVTAVARGHLVLIPRGASPFTRLELWVDMSTGALERLTFQDRRGGTTDWRFSSVEVDRPLADAQFEP